MRRQAKGTGLELWAVVNKDVGDRMQPQRYDLNPKYRHETDKAEWVQQLRRMTGSGGKTRGEETRRLAEDCVIASPTLGNCCEAQTFGRLGICHQSTLSSCFPHPHKSSGPVWLFRRPRRQEICPSMSFINIFNPLIFSSRPIATLRFNLGCPVCTTTLMVG